MMEYGYFDDRSREYVITNPATPAPWMNHLGSDRYSMIISNNGSGCSYVNREQKVLENRFIYIRDDDDRDYWSCTWQPVAKDFRDYRSVCRHGLGYTKMYASYSGIHSEVLYYVPLDAEAEVWALNIENHSKRPRNLTVSGVCEFPAGQENGDYTLYTSKTLYDTNRIRYQVFSNQKQGRDEAFLGLAGAEANSYCGDKDVFLGAYRGFCSPHGIEFADLGEELSYASDSIGALSFKLTLEPGENRTVCFIAGHLPDEKSTEAIRHYEVHTRDAVLSDIRAIKKVWNERLQVFEVETPSKGFDEMVNVWNPYVCFSSGEISDLSQLLLPIIEKKEDGWYSKSLEELIEGYTDDRGKSFLKKISENLNTSYGAVTLDPPADEKLLDDSTIARYNPGVAENGGIFSQSQGRYILSEALLGNGDNAFMYFTESAPSFQNKKADVRRIEPYAYGEYADGRYSPFFGRGHEPWDARAAGVIETACIEGICGIRPAEKGLYISPAIPSDWAEFKISLRFRDHDIFIHVKNPGHKQSGVEKLTLNGQAIEGEFIADDKFSDKNDIVVYL